MQCVWKIIQMCFLRCKMQESGAVLKKCRTGSSPRPAVWQTLPECDLACPSVGRGYDRGSVPDCRMAVGRINTTLTQTLTTPLVIHD